MGRSKPLDGSYYLLFCVLGAARVLRVTFGGEAVPSGYTLKLHFEAFTERGSVEKVDLETPNEAFVTFKHSKSRYSAYAHLASSIAANCKILSTCSQCSMATP